MSLRDDIESIVKSVDLELYDTEIVSENGSSIYRVSVVSPNIIDGKKEGVSLDRYVELTHLISPVLDITPPMGGEYRLEVGSPGIERKLTSLNHFQKSVGDMVALTLSDKTKLKGKLVDIVESVLSVEDEEKNIHTIEFGDIKKAKTYFEW